MSTQDLFGPAAAEFDAPVMPRVEFARGLWSRLEADLRPAPVPGTRAAPGRRRSRIAFLLRRPRRMVLVAAILLLFLSGVATATFFGVRTWVSGSPRGVQVTSDFRLSAVFTTKGDDPAWYWATALGADGHDLYLAEGRHVYRVRGIDGPTPSPLSLFLDLDSVHDPAMRAVAWHGLAPSPNGDLFVLGSSDWGSPPRETSVLVVRPDGSRQTVVTYRELRRRGVLPRRAQFAIAAPASNRLFLIANASRRRHPWNVAPFPVTSYLVEVLDPNGDGDWTDRVVRRIAVPRSLVGFHDRDPGRWWVGDPVVEPSLPGDDRSRSLVLPTTWDGATAPGSDPSTYRLYRVDDANDDGDVLDPGEVTRLRVHAPGSWLAARVERSSGRPRRELVMTAAGRSDRISIMADDGRFVDIGRSFPGSFDDVHTALNGDIYAVVEGAGQYGNRTRVYRLSESPNSEQPARELRPAAVRAPSATGRPLLLVSRNGTASTAPATSRWLRPDGSGLVSAASAQTVCGAVHGGAVAFTSDLTVPREPFVYVSQPGSPAAEKVTERPLVPVCPFDGRRLVLASPTWSSSETLWTLAAFDLRTERTRRIVDAASRFAISPDAHRIAYVKRRGDRDDLEVVDLRTLRTRRLAVPAHDGSLAPLRGQNDGPFTVGDLVWSPDGRRIAVTSGRGLRPWELERVEKGLFAPAHSYSVMVLDLRGDRARRRTSVLGGPPTVAWSPDGTKLLVCSADHAGSETACDGGLGVSPRGLESSSVLRVVSATGRLRSRVVTHGTVTFAGWSPEGGFAWADYAKLHLPGGRTMRLDTYGGEWVGWSSDGRYVVQGPEDGFRVVDVRTGRRHRLMSPGRAQDASVRWWR
jgi:hypothetical protein